MPKPHTVQAGKDFLADVMQRAGITPGSNPAIDALLQNEAALAAAGEGALGRSEISRQHNELRQRTEALAAREEEVNEVAETQRSWWERNRDAVAERDALKAGRQPDPQGGQPNVPAGTKLLTPEEAKRIADEAVASAIKGFSGDVVTFGAQLTTLSGKHYKEFGDVLDTGQLLALAEEKKIPLPVAYDVLVADARKTRQDAAVEERITKARQEGEQAGRDAAMASVGNPYPVGEGRAVSPVMATLATRAGQTPEQRSAANPEHSLSAALKTFHEETAKGAR